MRYFFHPLSRAASLALVFTSLLFWHAAAQQDDAPAAQDEAPAAQDEATEEPATDRYTVPEADDVAALTNFINTIIEFRPSTQEEALEHQQKAMAALREAVPRVLKLEKDTSSAAYRTAKRVALQLAVVDLQQAKAEEHENLIAEIEKFIDAAPQPELMDLGMAVQICRQLEQLESPAAGKAYETFGTLLSKQSDEQIAAFGKSMLGSARRLNLVGNTMELNGTTLDGKPFKLDSLKGKVVLVDFWATWCGPCKAELPNVLANYKKYHDKGFEVVGVSLDQDRVALEDYVKEQNLPWTTLHENDGTGQHPSATHYGVNAIPFMVLVGKDGKVLSLQARGEELNRLLAEQFDGTK